MQYDISKIEPDLSDDKQEIKVYQHDYTKVKLVITNNEPEFADVGLNLGNIELNRVGSEHDFDEFKLDISDINNYFSDFEQTRYDFYVFNQIINF